MNTKLNDERAAETRLFQYNQFQKGECGMRDFSIDLLWAKIQTACVAVGGWLGYF